jgi:hypothetical protein
MIHLLINSKIFNIKGKVRYFNSISANKIINKMNLRKFSLEISKINIKMNNK